MFKKRIVFSILSTLIVLFLIQSGLFTIIAVTFHIDIETVTSFYFINAGAHLVLIIFLLVLKDLFYKVPTGEHLDRVNLANLLTIIRMSCITPIAYLLLLARSYRLIPILLAYTAVAFLTDFFDGMISRKTGQRTKIGQYLDSVGDYSILIVVSVAFNYYELISAWFFALIIVRLLFQWFGGAVVYIYQKKVSYHISFLGKASVFAAMTLFGFALLQLIPQIRDFAVSLRNILQYIAAVIVIISLLEKVRFIYWDLHLAWEAKKFKGTSKN